MSDYYGSATLEDWLAEEVFKVPEVPPDVVARFEVYRSEVEANIEAWMDSDDGDGNRLSWRGWGRGFCAIPEDGVFDTLVQETRPLVTSSLIKTPFGQSSADYHRAKAWLYHINQLYKLTPEQSNDSAALVAVANQFREEALDFLAQNGPDDTLS